MYNEEYAVESILEGGLLLVVGMSVTMIVLGGLAGLIWFLKAIDERVNTHRIKSYADKVETRKIDAEVNDEIVAVLAAAATVMLRRPVSIRRIRFLKPDVEPAWAVTGRLNIMASHAISRRKSHS
jgi:Na+-transporting methylmalonyl-CoA/oxaloacetate decarboxylase gamma subunit